MGVCRGRPSLDLRNGAFREAGRPAGRLHDALSPACNTFALAMPSLSQQDRDIIAEYPLNDSLEFPQDKLLVTDEPLTDGTSHRLPKAILLLLAALMGHEAAYNL